MKRYYFVLLALVIVAGLGLYYHAYGRPISRLPQTNDSTNIAKPTLSKISYTSTVQNNVSVPVSTSIHCDTNRSGSNQTAVVSNTQARSIPVLLYHGEGGALANTPVDLFIDQLCVLKENGWHTITMSQFQNFMKGTGQVPDKSFLLTFDDGRKDSYYTADPVLNALGFHAIMFVITGLSMPDSQQNSTFYLSRSELQTMVSSGRWELESHGKEDHRLYQIPVASATGGVSNSPGHFLSNKFSVTDSGTGQSRLETNQEFTSRITNDLTQAKNTLESDFAIPVTAFAYPYNDFGQDSLNFTDSRAIIAQVVPSLYSFAFYQTWPPNGDTFNYPTTNPQVSQFMMRRIEPGIDWNGAKLLSILTNGRAKDIPYHATSFGPEWIPAWGNVQSGSGGLSLSLQAATSTTGVETLLNGSGGWKDFSLQTNINWLGGNDVILIARHTDNYNYLSCTFSNNQISLNKHVNNIATDIAVKPYPFTGSKNNIVLLMTVKGNNATCSVNGQTVTGSAQEPILQSGGIGIEGWDKTLGAANMLVNSLDVNAI